MPGDVSGPRFTAEDTLLGLLEFGVQGQLAVGPQCLIPCDRLTPAALAISLQ